ncbi:response regulator [Ruicaihuangia caeni]|uniref:Response regulator transcription factor n=1 Tax=Ruicaihuangia caeni TaxID=3042517 RepID=A0AAW6T9S7_9MICO|nr:response regulator transcription factor [Klugiella sp. YN-L-19]MDI2098830.1 response regulator transcription factor [Klugiella sp. YN-L-19]
MAEITVVIADDHPVYREGLAALLTSIGDLRVVATAADGAEAVQAALAERPDVVVMDVQMPVMDGIEATRRIIERQPDAGILMLTMSEDDGTVAEAMRAGARGYVLKGAGQADVARAIRAVAAGDAVLGGRLASRVGEYFARRSATPFAESFPQLTEREREVLQHLAAGRTNSQIAELLYLAPKTVRNTVSNIFAKLQVRDRGEAAALAREAGLE